MAQPAIPISQIVDIVPGVVGAGGSPLSLNAIFISKNSRVPASSLLEFSTTDEVADYFGEDSTEFELSSNYFLGFDNSTKKPGTLFMGYFAEADSSGWVRGASLAGMTLAQLKAVTGTLSIKVDDTVYAAAALDLTLTTSFSDAATMIQTALTLGAAGTVTWDAANAQFVVTSATTGVASDVAFATGTTAAALGLDSGVRTAGVDADTPATAMERMKAQSQNWAPFMTIYNTTSDAKEEYAAWCNSQNNLYAYVAWDNDSGYFTPSNPSTFGSIVDTKNYEGTIVIYGSNKVGAFVCGFIGSIDWQATNGRATAAFKSQTGLEVSVDSLANANAVLSNNASYYGLYQAPGPNNIYSILYDGRMNGSKFRWLDTYVNQIYLNSQLRLAIFEGLLSVKSAPYNSQGETLIRAWCADPILEALNNGTIRTGVSLSASQKATIAQQAGLDISDQLYGQGYYLQILPATAQVRSQRQSPPCKLWYMDGGSIQAINLASIAVL